MTFERETEGKYLPQQLDVVALTLLGMEVLPAPFASLVVQVPARKVGCPAARDHEAAGLQTLRKPDPHEQSLEVNRPYVREVNRAVDRWVLQLEILVPRDIAGLDRLEAAEPFAALGIAQAKEEVAQLRRRAPAAAGNAPVREDHQRIRAVTHDRQHALVETVEVPAVRSVQRAVVQAGTVDDLEPAVDQP